MDSNVLIPIVVQVITGVIGGQAVGAALKNAAMAQLPKILSGAIGGVARRADPRTCSSAAQAGADAAQRAAR